MRTNEKELLQALQDIVTACSAEAIKDVETTHGRRCFVMDKWRLWKNFHNRHFPKGFSSSDAHAYTVGKVQSIAEHAIREAAAAREREKRARILREQTRRNKS